METAVEKSKAYVSGMVAFREDELPPGALEKAQRVLTINQRQYIGEAKAKRFFARKDGWLWLPRAYAWNELGRRYDFVDRRSDGYPLKRAQFTGELGGEGYHSEQPDFVSAMAEGCMRNGYGGFGEAPCGTGKTVMGAAIAARLARSTLVIVNKGFLMDQWVDSFSTFLKVDGKYPSVGKAQQDRCDFGPAWPLCVTTIQSLASRRWPKEFYRSWGTVIVDETHHMPADTWFNGISRVNCRYLIGMTATLRRKDGMEDAFAYAMGTTLHKMTREEVEADVWYFPFKWLGSKSDATNHRGHMDMTKVNRTLSVNVARNTMIVGELTKAARAGRKVLLLAARRDHLENIMEMLPGDMKATAGYYVGSTPSSKLKHVAEHKRIMLGTFKMAEEGLDVPSIDLLVLATPMEDVEQAVGRCLRYHKEKMRPIIVDIVDGLPPLIKKASKRDDFYRQEGVTVRNRYYAA